jgi:hypothetical protein
MIPTDNILGRAYEKIVRRHGVLLTTHVVLGLLSGLVLMSQEDFRRFPYWGRVGIAALVRHLMASWPYVVSGVACYRRDGITLLNLVIFEVILVAGTGLGILAYIGAGGFHLEGFEILWVSFGQAWLFTFAATRLMTPRADS